MNRSTLLLKRSVKSAAGFAWSKTGGLRRPNDSVSILTYHRVVADITKAEQEAIFGLVISTETFRRHCELLNDAYDVVPLEAVPEIIAGRRRSNRPTAVITFDDGYQDFYDEAFPVLDKLGLPATVFLPTAYMGQSTPLDHDRVYWLLRLARNSSVAITDLLARIKISDERGLNLRNGDGLLTMTDEVVYLRHDLRKEIIDELERILDGEFAGYPSEYDLLSWESVKELSAKGISFGSHTLNHFVLTLEDAAVVSKELAESKQELEARIGTPVVTLAYPNGRYNAAVKAAAEAAGYEIAVTTENRINRNGCDLLALGRTGLCEESTRGIAGQYSARVGALRLGE